MKLNSPESLKTGRKLIEKHGSWSNVRDHSRQTRSGVYVVNVEDPQKLQQLRNRLEKLAG
jgi:hypothetical protein